VSHAGSYPQFLTLYTDTPTYPYAADNAKYINDYADHFDIKSRCRLGVTIDRLQRAESGDRWAIVFRTKSHDGYSAQQVELFDKVIVTSGAFSKAFMPTYEGIESFRGKVIHVQGYKR
jgi:cation diffusion facilitator CzcD-associated flavoprotein CzcO